jgi:hypothetical protein
MSHLKHRPSGRLSISQSLRMERTPERFTNFRAVYDDLTDDVMPARHQFLPDHLRNWSRQIDETPSVSSIGAGGFEPRYREFEIGCSYLPERSRRTPFH